MKTRLTVALGVLALAGCSSPEIAPSLETVAVITVRTGDEVKHLDEDQVKEVGRALSQPGATHVRVLGDGTAIVSYDPSRAKARELVSPLARIEKYAKSSLRAVGAVESAEWTVGVTQILEGNALQVKVGPARPDAGPVQGLTITFHSPPGFHLGKNVETSPDGLVFIEGEVLKDPRHLEKDVSYTIETRADASMADGSLEVVVQFGSTGAGENASVRDLGFACPIVRP